MRLTLKLGPDYLEIVAAALMPAVDNKARPVCELINLPADQATKRRVLLTFVAKTALTLNLLNPTLVLSKVPSTVTIKFDDDSKAVQTRSRQVLDMTVPGLDRSVHQLLLCTTHYSKIDVLQAIIEVAFACVTPEFEK